MKNEINELKLEIEKLEELSLETSIEDNIDQKYYDLLEKFNRLSDYPFQESEQKIMSSLKKKLNKIKTELDLFDEDAELDKMFPNGIDED